MNEATRKIFDDTCSRYGFFSKVSDDVMKAYEILYASYSSGNKLLTCGNGGSATDASHIVGELVKGFMLKRPFTADQKKAVVEAADGKVDTEFLDRIQGSLPAISLSEHVGLMTAVVNDIGGDLIFAQQVAGFGAEGDVFLGITTSGNSKNILEACAVAKAKGLKTIGLTGRDGGKLKTMVDCCIIAPSDSTPVIQDMHTPIYHVLCAMLESSFWED